MNIEKITKIANKIAMDYEYIYDPNHSKNPGGGFEKTEKGWSKGVEEKKQKGLFENKQFQEYMSNPQNRKLVKTVINSTGNKLRAGLAALAISVSAFAGFHDDASNFVATQEGKVVKNGYHVPYKCQANKRTIGYGETDPKIVKMGKLTESQARSLLKIRMKQHERKALKLINPKMWAKMHPKQKMAVLSLSYNMGSLTPCKKLRKYLNEGNYEAAVKEFADCNKVTVEDEVTGKKKKVVSKGLDRRRKIEMKLFREGTRELEKLKK